MNDSRGRKHPHEMEARELAKAEAAGPDRVPPTPRPSAGVILARDLAAGPEVLLVRRRPDVHFAAGAFVFPGGTLDPEDSDPGWRSVLAGVPAEAIEGAGDGDDPPARAFAVAALREMFEETGVLLVSSSGHMPPGAALREAREALVAGRRGFLDIVSQLEVPLAADRLVLCARWITPEALSRRYDARFFLAEAPPAVQVAPEPGELVEHVWVAPNDALDRYFASQFPMLFPTATTLGWLTEAGGSVAEWRALFLLKTVVPILPRLRRVGGEVISVLPGEPGYDDREEDG